MHKLTAVSTLVLSAFLVTACDDDAKSNVPGGRGGASLVTAPTSFNVAGVSANVTAGSAIADPNAGGTCTALTIPLQLSVQAGAAAVAITEVTARFITSASTSMPQVTLPAPVPTVQFGSGLIEAKSVRTIPLMLPIGCVVEPAGTVVVLVSTRDRHGNSNTTSVSTPVNRPGNRPGTTPGNTGGGNTPAR
jgi:hypothetical protein